MTIIFEQLRVVKILLGYKSLSDELFNFPLMNSVTDVFTLGA